MEEEDSHTSVKQTPKLPVLERLENRKDEELLSPICVIVVGMAGAGKTQLMAQLQRSLQTVPTSTTKEDGKKMKTKNCGYKATSK